VEAGSNSSTVALRVVGGDKKGSLESEGVNMITSPTGLGLESDCAGEGQQQLYTTLYTRSNAQQMEQCSLWTNVTARC
jgi:hypothetical protein